MFEKRELGYIKEDERSSSSKIIFWVSSLKIIHLPYNVVVHNGHENAIVKK